jgi:hypothetical protein
VYRTVGGALLPGSAIYRRRYERTATNGHLRAKRCPVGADGAADADPITGSVSPIASDTDQTQQQLFGPCSVEDLGDVIGRIAPYLGTDRVSPLVAAPTLGKQESCPGVGEPGFELGRGPCAFADQEHPCGAGFSHYRDASCAAPRRGSQESVQEYQPGSIPTSFDRVGSVVVSVRRRSSDVEQTPSPGSRFRRLVSAGRRRIARWSSRRPARSSPPHARR